MFSADTQKMQKILFEIFLENFSKLLRESLNLNSQNYESKIQVESFNLRPDLEIKYSSWKDIHFSKCQKMNHIKFLNWSLKKKSLKVELNDLWLLGILEPIGIYKSNQNFEGDHQFRGFWDSFEILSLFGLSEAKVDCF